MIVRKIVSTLVFSLFLLAQSALSQVSEPTIISAKFTNDGKLEVTTSFEAIAGCYVTVNGGLSKSSVTTGIVGIQLTEGQAQKGRVKIKTKRKYYCKQRTLYVNVELTCLNEVIGSATSGIKTVNVPLASVRK